MNLAQKNTGTGCAYLTRMQLVKEYPINTYEGWRRVSPDRLPYVVRGRNAVYRRDDVNHYIEYGCARRKRGRPRNFDKR
ncbi:hypothetical protein V5T82_15375 [Magnetovibrio sp. PR-2]|uniref:hypothetical protein n=1 Tax=Magnetovibrio sp. PR-2 TaxID=3120356 RepID=UPI002FCE686C